jgi:hypothetical protein
LVGLSCQDHWRHLLLNELEIVERQACFSNFDGVSDRADPQRDLLLRSFASNTNDDFAEQQGFAKICVLWLSFSWPSGLPSP